MQAADCSDEDPLVEFDSPALAREDDLFVGLFEGRMKIKNDSKKSRWDLASDGFWSKKSIRELLSLLLPRHGRVCVKTLQNANQREIGLILNKSIRNVYVCTVRSVVRMRVSCVL